MSVVEQLVIKAKELTPTERIKLIEALLFTLDKPNSDIEKSWIAESEARYEAYEKGDIASVDWDDIKKRYEG